MSVSETGPVSHRAKVAAVTPLPSQSAAAAQLREQQQEHQDGHRPAPPIIWHGTPRYFPAASPAGRYRGRSHFTACDPYSVAKRAREPISPENVQIKGKPLISGRAVRLKADY